jgi:hypothetical protein
MDSIRVIIKDIISIAIDIVFLKIRHELKTMVNQ